MRKAFLMQIIEILAEKQNLDGRLDFLKDLDESLMLIGYVRTVPDHKAKTVTYAIDAPEGETIDDKDHEAILFTIHLDLLTRGYEGGLLLSYVRTDIYMIVSFTHPDYAVKIGAN